MIQTIGATMLALGLGLAAQSGTDVTFRGYSGDSAEYLAAQLTKAGKGSSTATASGPARQTIMVPACAGNEPVRGLLDASCPQALALCAATPVPNDVMIWIFTGPAGVRIPAPGQWVRSGQRCMLPSAAAAAQALPVLTARDFRRLPLPPGGVNVQPPNLRTLINVPTNLFVQADVTVLDTTLLGFPVRVRATPQSFRWTFGDGRGLVTDDPGAAYPDLRITHTYTRPGVASLALATTYSGEYSVAGGPWLPINGTAEVSSSPVTLTVLAAENHLIGGNG